MLLMKGFLEQVSDYVLSEFEHKFKDLLLVFPNQRSIAYFNNSLKKNLNKINKYNYMTYYIDKNVKVSNIMELIDEIKKKTINLNQKESGGSLALFKIYGDSHHLIHSWQ